MSESAVPNALERVLTERPDDWRTLADLAVDFAPPHVARAAAHALSDPTTDPSAVLEAIGAAAEPVLDDTPLVIGSIEPESLDFAPVSTLEMDATTPAAGYDLDFGAGTLDTTELLDSLDHEVFDDGAMLIESETVVDPLDVEVVDDEMPFAVEGIETDELDDLDDLDGEDDDGDLLDVGD